MDGRILDVKMETAFRVNVCCKYDRLLKFTITIPSKVLDINKRNVSKF